MSFVLLLTLFLIQMKVLNALNWPWLYVFSPVIIAILMAALILTFVMCGIHFRHKKESEGT